MQDSRSTERLPAECDTAALRVHPWARPPVGFPFTKLPKEVIRLMATHRGTIAGGFVVARSSKVAFAVA